MLTQILLSAVTGALLILTFPKFDVEVLAWVALVPLLWAIRNQPPVRAALLGWVSGFVFFTGLIPWIINVLHHYGHLPAPVSIAILLLMTAYLALFFSSFAFLLRLVVIRAGVPEVLLAPVLWVSLEFARGILLSGFPWELLGYSQFQTLPMVQIADITGVYGVSFVIVFVNVAVYRVIEAFGKGNVKPAMAEALAAAVLLIGTAAYGYLRLDEIKPEPKAGTPVRIAVLQGNIPQDMKWEQEFQDQTMRIYADLTVRAGLIPPDLIVWPETATPFFFQDTFTYRNRILDLASDLKVFLLFGSPAYDRKGRENVYYNSAFLVSPGKEIVGRYDKIHLVPFGEYAPLSGILSFTRDIIGSMGDFQYGEGVKNLSIPRGKFGVLICYEVIFPGLTRKFVNEGARFLVNITNDAWFGRSAAPYQHLSMARLRAIENRVPIARSANTGISGFIDAAGRLRQSSDIFTKAILLDTLYLNHYFSFYTRFGDVFAYACIVSMHIFFIIGFWKRKNRVERDR
ncbi:MAG TPA: apolipoprotein N-acyltransferase [Thermodesulfobacteriota bacterium]|nr:apolipoprotein N-acyltransferase [Thermodesulfobacteriota bacterium]